MDEHTVYQPGYDANEKRRTFTSTPTTPYDVGDIWMDADTVKRCTTARASGAYVAGDWTATTLDAIADGGTFSRVRSASLSPAGLVLLDQVVEETYGLILKTDITAHHVKGTAIVQSSSARLVTDSEKGDWDDSYQIALEAYDLSMEVSDDIVAGYLTLSQYTDILGTWYKTGGIKINASSGIVIYGLNKAFVTRASEFGTDQCYVGSDGSIRAGGGDVRLDSDGIKLFGERLKLYNTLGSWTGVIGCSTNAVFLHGAQSGDDAEVAGQEVRIIAEEDVRIYAGAGHCLNIAQCEFMHLPRKSSAPAGSEGRMYFNTSDKKLYLRTTLGGTTKWWTFQMA